MIVFKRHHVQTNVKKIPTGAEMKFISIMSQLCVSIKPSSFTVVKSLTRHGFAYLRRNGSLLSSANP